MKKSEARELILEVIREYSYSDFYVDMADDILDKILSVGMLPPETAIEKNKAIQMGYCVNPAYDHHEIVMLNIWEQEDENK